MKSIGTVGYDGRSTRHGLADAFGLGTATAILLCYALEDRSPWFILTFGAACALGSIYGFFQGAWPFGLVEAVWTPIALGRFRSRMSG